MTTGIRIPARPDGEASGPPDAVVQRTAFYLESRGDAIFAWLHQGNPCRHGVILCAPVGHEQVHAHRSLRHLADALARAGFVVLRFDYHGAGDSAGADEDPERYAVWLANIRDARAWMQTQLGCQRFSLVGLRLGALLAAQSAVEQAVDSLVLWAPVVKGRTFVRELKAARLTAAGGPSEESKDIEAAGFVLTEQTARDLSRLDLFQSHPLCRRALIVARDDMQGDPRLLEHFKTLDIETHQITPPGYADMMAEPHLTRVPHEAIAGVVNWLGESASPIDGEGDGFDNPGFPARCVTEWVSNDRQRIRERAVTISERPHLFGIVGEPDAPAPDHLPFIVMVNAGSAYRVGPNRLYVSLARRLAAAGFRCLRMDLNGLGDSVCPDPERENDPYPATAFRDIEITLRYLQSRPDVGRVVLMGLCSGAYDAFQSAAQLANPVLVESILINPLTYFWKEGMVVGASPAMQVQSFQSATAALRQPGKWLKFLSGKSKIGVAGALRMLVDQWKLHRQSGRKPLAGPSPAPGEVSPSHPRRDDVPGDLDRIVSAGRHLTCFFSRSDPGYGLLRLYARRQVDDLVRAGRLEVVFLENADHTFSRRVWQLALGEAVAEHLVRRYSRSAE